MSGQQAHNQALRANQISDQFSNQGAETDSVLLDVLDPDALVDGFAGAQAQTGQLRPNLAHPF